MAPNSRTSLAHVQTMPVIAEDESALPPQLPKQSSRRRSAGFSNGGRGQGSVYPPFAPPRPARPPHGAGLDFGPAHPNAPPGLALSDGSPETSKTSSTSREEEKEPLRDGGGNEWFARRGGWYRLALIGMLFAVIITALAVGLTVGIKKNNASHSPAPVSATLFPCGSYTVTMALTTVRTGCTTLAPTFRCYPYLTLNDSYTGASAVFHWVIAPNSDPDTIEASPYAVSSGGNPFALQFDALPMTLADEGDALDERYTFSFDMDKAVIPAAELVPGLNEAAVCWYNSTRVEAALYTRRRAVYNPTNDSSIAAGSSASGSTNGGAPGVGSLVGGSSAASGLGSSSVGGGISSPQQVFVAWPYAAELSQTRAAGPGVPDCRSALGNGDGGDEIQDADFEVQGGGVDKECGCDYANWGDGMAFPSPSSTTSSSTSTSSTSSTSTTSSTFSTSTTTDPASSTDSTSTTDLTSSTDPPSTTDVPSTTTGTTSTSVDGPPVPSTTADPAPAAAR